MVLDEACSTAATITGICFETRILSDLYRSGKLAL